MVYNRYCRVYWHAVSGFEKLFPETNATSYLFRIRRHDLKQGFALEIGQQIFFRPTPNRLLMQYLVCDLHHIYYSEPPMIALQELYFPRGHLTTQSDENQIPKLIQPL